MKVTVEFTCPECSLWTPGVCDLPDADPRRSLTLEHECLHCGAPLSRTQTLGQWRQEGRRAEEGEPC